MTTDELSTQQLDLLKRKLSQLRNELTEQLSNSSSATETVELDQTLQGRVSRMDAIQQQSVALSARKKAELRLRKVIAALNRMKDGDYGYCHQCDDTIPFKRLEVQPESVLCLVCQAKKDEA